MDGGRKVRGGRSAVLAVEVVELKSGGGACRGAWERFKLVKVGRWAGEVSSAHREQGAGAARGGLPC